jgi:hypothetical protein
VQRAQNLVRASDFDFDRYFSTQFSTVLLKTFIKNSQFARYLKRSVARKLPCHAKMVFVFSV